MNISFLNTNQTEQTQSKLPNPLESSSLDNLFGSNTSPFLNLVENHLISSPPLESSNSNTINTFSFSQPKVWDEISNPNSKSIPAVVDVAVSSEKSTNDSIEEREIENPSVDHDLNKIDNLKEEKDLVENEISKEEKDLKEEKELDEESSNKEKSTNDKEEIPSNIFDTLSKWLLNFNSIEKPNTVSKPNNETKPTNKLILKENEDSSDNKKKAIESKKESKELANESKSKADSNLFQWEKKIVTTNELFSKLNANKAKNSEEMKSNSKMHTENRNLEEKVSEKNANPIAQDGKNKLTKTISNLNEIKEIGKKTSLDRKSSKDSQDSVEKNDSKDIPKITMEKMEKGETLKDISKWEIRNERSKVDAQIQNHNNSSKENFAIVESSSSANTNSHNDNRDHGSESFRSEIFKINSNKKPEVTSFKSNIDPEDVKANMDRLVQRAKIHIINEGRSQAEIRLNPLELGRMVLKISVQNDKVDGKVLVDSEAVKIALQSDLSSLKEDLRAQGLDLQSLTIDVNLDSHSDFNKKQDGFSADNFMKMPSERERFNELEALRIKKSSESLLDVIA